MTTLHYMMLDSIHDNLTVVDFTHDNLTELQETVADSSQVNLTMSLVVGILRPGNI